MIEVRLELKLDSFLVNSMGKSEDVSCQMSERALKFTCEKVALVRRLSENRPSADFEFLGVAGKHEAQGETDTEFDDRIFNYFTARTTFDATKVTIASGDSGFVALAKGKSSGEMGRMQIAESANRSGLSLEMVFKQGEFDAAWDLTMHQKARSAIATLVCFKLLPGAITERSANDFVAGILACSLQFAPST
ncbi:MAG: hypothetical protein Q8L69_16705 [Gallionellaceae bacterium]|nr:hypothetical protein [Gallionellaceae bacterium]